MLLKRSGFLLLAASVISVVLFAGTVGMTADVPCGPDFTQFKQITTTKTGAISTSASSFYVKFLGVIECTCNSSATTPFVCTDGVFSSTACAVPDGTYYKWSYQTQTSSGSSANLSPLSNIQFLVPVNNSCDLQNTYFGITGGKPLSLASNSNDFPLPGDFSVNPYWRFVYERRIIKETSDDSSNRNVYAFFTDKKSTPKPMSLYVKAGVGELIAQTLGPSTPVDTPVIETSCTQIVKIPKDKTQPETCLNVCYELGGALGAEKRLVSAEVYGNRFCDSQISAGTPILIFDPRSAVPELRASALQCTPCGIEINGVKSIDCSNVTGPASTFPFDLQLSTYKVRCDAIIKSIEPTGFTFDLGADPCQWNGSQYTCYSCPAGYRDTGTACVR